MSGFFYKKYLLNVDFFCNRGLQSDFSVYMYVDSVNYSAKCKCFVTNNKGYNCTYNRFFFITLRF